MQKQNILNVCLLNTLKYNSGNITILVLLYMIMIKHLFNECVCKPLQPYLMYRQAKKKKVLSTGLLLLVYLLSL